MRFKIIHSMLAALTLANTACAQDKASEIDKIFSWANATSPGCVCAVSHQGKIIVNRAYGQADLERGIPLTEHSVFDVASLTKQFVAATVLILAEEKRISLTDDVHKYIPELPGYGHQITIDQLMTHTSGVRDWTGLTMLSPKNDDALSMILRQRALDFVPGEEWSYSNSGYVLLKEIVGRITGGTFADFARQRLFEPLGMKATRYQNDLRQIVENRALAYEREKGTWLLNMKLDNDRGGGGALLSTAADLLTWNDALTSNKLGTYVTTKLQEPAVLNNGRKLGYARGLFLNMSRGGKVVGHTGGSAGYGSLLTRIPEQQLSIAILCNSGDAGDRGAFARKILDILVPPAKLSTTSAGTSPTDKSKVSANLTSGDSAATAVTQTGRSDSSSDLAGKDGLYFSEQTFEPIRLTTNNGRLGIAGGPTLVFVDKNIYRNPSGQLTFMSGDLFQIQLLSNDHFEMKSMEGKITRYRRARIFTPGTVDLLPYTGRYVNNELSTTFIIERKGDGLLLQLEHALEKKLDFKQVDEDIFQANRMYLRFIKDKTGKVIALEYSNPVLRKMQFAKRKEK